MARRVRLSDDAFADIAAIRAWYHQPGAGSTARRRVQRILEAIERLRETPCLHRSGDRPGTRLMTVERHAVVYEVDPDTGSDQTAGDVFVIRVFGPGRQRPGQRRPAG